MQKSTHGGPNLNLRFETIKLPEQNIGETLQDINFDKKKTLLNKTPEVKAMKAKVDKWD